MIARVLRKRREVLRRTTKREVMGTVAKRRVEGEV